MFISGIILSSEIIQIFNHIFLNYFMYVEIEKLKHWSCDKCSFNANSVLFQRCKALDKVNAENT